MINDTDPRSRTTVATAGLLEAVLRGPAVTGPRRRWVQLHRCGRCHYSRSLFRRRSRRCAVDADVQQLHLSDPVRGFCSLATACFNLPYSPVANEHERHVCLVIGTCSFGVAPYQSFLGDTMQLNNKRCYSDVFVEHFIPKLPSMRMLTSLEFRRTVPDHLSRTDADGIKNHYWLHHFTGLTHYWLHHFTGLTFGTGQLRSEARPYASANAKGRMARQCTKPWRTPGTAGFSRPQSPCCTARPARHPHCSICCRRRGSRTLWMSWYSFLHCVVHSL
jgi:hypothetical protein